MELVTREYQGGVFTYQDDGWFNATQAASRFGKEPAQWARLPETIKYLNALESKYGKNTYLKTKRGNAGGTWMHHKLAVRFAQWLDIDFAIWCDEQIEDIIHGTLDKTRSRIEAANNYSLMSEIVLLTRRDQGKDTKFFHYANEALLVNEVLTGKRESINRSELSATNLKFLSRLERINAVLFARGLDKDQRKDQLRIALQDMHAKTLEKLTSAKELA